MGATVTGALETGAYDTGARDMVGAVVTGAYVIGVGAAVGGIDVDMRMPHPMRVPLGVCTTSACP